MKKLSSPIKIQDYLDGLAMNHEKNGETYMSPRRVLREQKAHCLEGAMLAALAIWISGGKPLLFDLKAENDVDHVVALYRYNGCFGAISKTNHAVLRFRDPVYRNLRELALSYFHEYFDNESRNKTLRYYSAAPFDLRRHGRQWIVTEDDLQPIAQAIDDAPHRLILPRKNEAMLRKADSMELKAGEIIEWNESDPRT